MAHVPRRRHVDWLVWRNDIDNTFNNDQVDQMILMDIREQLAQLLTVFQCPNAQAIPGILRDIAMHTKPRRRKRKAR
jgi:hypothetical protein